jgi:hypothetical protein
LSVHLFLSRRNATQHGTHRRSIHGITAAALTRATPAVRFRFLAAAARHLIILGKER